MRTQRQNGVTSAVEFDLVVRGGLVIDGSGDPAYRAADGLPQRDHARQGAGPQCGVDLQVRRAGKLPGLSAMSELQSTAVFSLAVGGA